MTRSTQRSLTFILLAALGVVLAFLSIPTSPQASAQEVPTVTPLISPSDLAAPTPTRAPLTRPQPSLSLTEGAFTLELYFDSLEQGQAGLVRVFGEGISGARGLFIEHIIEFFPASDGYYALIAPGIEQAARGYEFSVVAFGANDERTTITAQVNVTVGGFITQDFTIPADRVYLLDPEVERYEFARLDAIFETVTLETLWDDGGFQRPINAELTSPFGAFRTLNNTITTRHTGWDLRAATGTPVGATAGGRIAFAGLMDVRGNLVVIDHGYGLFSTYSHLSQIHVTRGQNVVAGQIIGVSGNTGRSSGAHLHWEMVVNGEWIDSALFLDTWIPEA